MKYNKHFSLLTENYLFADIAKRVVRYKEKNPSAAIINLGIGDITQPLAPAIVEAGQRALSETGAIARGYCDSAGYDFLREAIAKRYANLGVKIDKNEVFVGDGAKGDMAQILRLFRKCTALIPNPVYPAYLDANIIAGNAVIFAVGSRENGFLPMPDGRECDIIYLCSPSNPTGAAYGKEELRVWIEYAKRQGAVILFDAAYDAFIDNPNIPRSIFLVEGARDVAIEFNSLSKSAGFTGTRCGWTIVPKTLAAHRLWARYKGASYNGTPYVVQRMAEAALGDEGLRQTALQLKKYKQNAKRISAELSRAGVWHTGGLNSPYVWLYHGGDSFEYFDFMLRSGGIVGTPGAGFGSAGEGYFRLSAFGEIPDLWKLKTV